MKQIIIIAILCALPRHAFPQDAKKITGTWKLTAMAFDFDADGNPDRDLWKSCREGSSFTFKEDGSGIQYKGPKPCGNPAQNPASFTWSVSGSNEIHLTQGGNADDVLVQFTEPGKLKLYWKKSKLLLQLEQ